MPYFDSFAISAAGMDVERLRVDVAAMNMANANVALDASGAGFSPMQVVVKQPRAAAESAAFTHWLQAPTASVERLPDSPRQVQEPGHPLADAQGFVRYPAVDHTREMLTVMGAMRAYEANVAALNMTRMMALKALDIGGAQ